RAGGDAVAACGDGSLVATVCGGIRQLQAATIKSATTTRRIVRNYVRPMTAATESRRATTTALLRDSAAIASESHLAPELLPVRRLHRKQHVGHDLDDAEREKHEHRPRLGPDRHRVRDDEERRELRCDRARGVHPRPM